MRTAYARRLRGDSNGEIAAWLNREGHTPRGRNALFTPWAVRDLLRTRFYVGVVVFRGAEFAGQHEATIDEQTSAAALALRGRARARRKTTGPSGVLQGRVFCPRCGSRLHAERNRFDRPRYRERHGIRCGSNGRSIVSDVIDAQLGEIWTAIELPKDWREDISQRATADATSAARLALEARKKRVATAFIDGALTEADYRRQVAEIDAELALMAPVSAPAYEEVAALLADLPRVWALATADERRRLLAPLLRAVYVNLDERSVAALTPTPGFDALLRGAMRSRPDSCLQLIDQRNGAPAAPRV